jgi:hypothetical protein
MIVDDVVHLLISRTKPPADVETVRVGVCAPVRDPSPIWDRLTKAYEKSVDGAHDIFIQIKSSQRFPLAALPGDTGNSGIQVHFPEQI